MRNKLFNYENDRNPSKQEMNRQRKESIKENI